MKNDVLVPLPPSKPCPWLHNMRKIQNLDLHLVFRSDTNPSNPFIPRNSSHTAILVMLLATLVKRERAVDIGRNDREPLAQHTSGSVNARDGVICVLVLGVDVSSEADHRRRVFAVVLHDGVHECTVHARKDVRDEGSADVL